MGTSARTPIVLPTGAQNVNCATQQPCCRPFPERSGTRPAAPVGVIDPFTAGSPSWPQIHRSQATSSVRFASKPDHTPKQSRSNVPLSSGGTPLCRDSSTQNTSSRLPVQSIFYGFRLPRLDVIAAVIRLFMPTSSGQNRTNRRKGLILVGPSCIPSTKNHPLREIEDEQG